MYVRTLSLIRSSHWVYSSIEEMALSLIHRGRAVCKRSVAKIEHNVPFRKEVVRLEP